MITVPLKVFFCEEMTSRTRTASPSPSKPTKIIKTMREHRIPMDTQVPQPATVDMISQCHSREYVEGVLACRVENGFGTKSRSIARSLPWTVGSVVDATRYALETGRPAFSPSSGFHHAHWDHGGSFTTFNGLVVAAIEARKAGARKVLVLDCDAHRGCGIEALKRRLGLDWLTHWGAGYHLSRDPSQAEPFLAALPAIIEENCAGVDVVIYQAGADMYVHDCGILDVSQLHQRDLVVFTALRKLGLGCAVTAAGGYSDIDTILKIHLGTALACVEAWSDDALDGTNASSAVQPSRQNRAKLVNINPRIVNHR